MGTTKSAVRRLESEEVCIIMKHFFSFDDEIFSHDIKQIRFQGAFGRIFINEKRSFAIKVFKVNHEDNTEKRKTYIHEIFNNECEAYELASNCSDSKDYIPCFYGKSPINGDIKDQDGNIVNNEYYIEYAYCMEFIDGNFIKLADGNYANKDEICGIFSNLGIKNIIDSSVVITDGRISKLVDFSMQDIEYFI